MENHKNDPQCDAAKQAAANIFPASPMANSMMFGSSYSQSYNKSFMKRHSGEYNRNSGEYQYRNSGESNRFSGDFQRVNEDLESASETTHLNPRPARPSMATVSNAEQPSTISNHDPEPPAYGTTADSDTTPLNPEENVWEDVPSQKRSQDVRELKILWQYSLPLAVTFLLQYSLTVASIFSVGHLGKEELGAVSLACMTSNITGFALFQGLSTCLDTLCCQAYGAGNMRKVGIYFQQCVCMSILVFLPIAAIWMCSEPLLALIIPEGELAALAALYLQIVALGVPGYIVFECGKKYLQAQGIFMAGTYVLAICAPLNAFLNWLLVWDKHVGIGYAGAPVAVVITEWAMAILIIGYIAFVDGRQCWFGLSPRAAFSNWGPMLKLAIPGVIMVEAEFLAFEILTLASSYFGSAALAAQSVLSTVMALAYQIPFSVAIAASTRVAHFIGAAQPQSAKRAARIALYSTILISTFNCTTLFVFRRPIAGLFSSDVDVVNLVAFVLPLCAVGQFFDCISSVVAGVLRGQGRQKIGGYVNLFYYYAVATPLSLFFGFVCGWELMGLWAGIIVGIVGIAATEAYFVLTSDWNAIIEKNAAMHRD
ncbi:putative transporter [Yarrowia sp. B02]|nr:putative transporter [Yarrowia sp. B02]